MSYEIYVVSHKDIRMPEGNIYIPVQVGPAKDDFSGFVRDNTGENISEKNPNYCELTAQYWAWKNRKADVKGLVHYRRLFSKGKRMLGASLEKKYENVLDEKTLVDVMKKHDAILPKSVITISKLYGLTMNILTKLKALKKHARLLRKNTLII